MPTFIVASLSVPLAIPDMRSQAFHVQQERPAGRPPYRPDHAVLAGFSGSFTPCPLSALAGRHDDGDLLCLTRRAGNNPHSSVKSDALGTHVRPYARNWLPGRRLAHTIDVQIDWRLGQCRPTAALPPQHRHHLIGKDLHLLLDLLATVPAELEPG